MSPEILDTFLKTLGFVHGEIFELCALKKPKSVASRCWVYGQDLHDASKWCDRYESTWNLYVCSNPISKGAEIPPGKRPKDEHVAVVRVFAIDIDPGDRPSRKDPADAGDDESNVAEHKCSAAAEIAAEIKAEIGAGVLMDTGRGRQILVKHEPQLNGDAGLLFRPKILRLLSKRFDRPGLAHVDPSTYNAARLVRLLGTVNLKTGRVSRLLGA